jgi:hypothetical protein
MRPASGRAAGSDEPVATAATAAAVVVSAILILVAIRACASGVMYG